MLVEYIDKCLVQGIGYLLSFLFARKQKGSISIPYEEIQGIFSLESCKCCFLWHWVKKGWEGKREGRGGEAFNPHV